MSAGQVIGRRPSLRLVWMLPAGIALLAGLDAAMLLLDLPAPITTARLPQVHGMLLVLGFVGTLIALERATALRRWYGFAAPALLGVGGLLLVADPVPLSYAKVTLVAGSAAFALVYLPLWRRNYDPALLVQLLGAALACAGAILWLGEAAMDRVVPWLIGFVVLTIAAERVELARITMGPQAGGRLLAHAWAIVAALLIGLAAPDAGAIALSVTLAALSGWLIVHDVARRTIRARGVTRYMAACILAGYVWLLIAAGVLAFGHPSSGAAYDAVVHAVFLGYTISMIMAHATTILPAVLHVTLPYRPAFWVPAALLQISLVVRLWLGDALGSVPAWRVGGVLGVIALLLFLVTAITSAILGPVRAGPRPSEASKTGGPRAVGVGERRARTAGQPVDAAAPPHRPAEGRTS